MKLSVEELLKPRYEVIADYPGSKFKVGSIMIFIKNFMHRVNGNPGSERYSDVFKSGNAIMFAQGPNGIHLYPHLFKPLQWWERREASEIEPERWVDINGYEGYYQISSYGRVRSVDRIIERSHKGKTPYKCVKKGKVLSLHKHSGGYIDIQISKNDKVELIYVHRLVGVHFVPNPENKPFINHINNVRDFNFYENLEWCTQSENLTHSVKTNNYSRKETPPYSRMNTHPTNNQ